jgi:hypothetical protein
MKFKAHLVLACSVLALGNISLAEPPPAKITVRVVDDDTQKPISSAEARISFTVPDTRGGSTSRRQTGLTDNDGNFTASDRTFPDITASAVKEGYYPSGIHYDLKLRADQSYDPSGVSVPILLKRIGNPIAMYARKRIQIEVPVLGKPVGYDLVAAHWVAPYGKGTASDLIFTVTRGNVASGILDVAFSNDGDGIQPILADPHEGSALRLPRVAPDEGYQSRLRLDSSTAAQKNRNYFYRIRTNKKNGAIVSAMYGKIHGEIDVDVINSKTAILLFTYYLNPDGTRNVEFDPKRNLFNNLPALEQVAEP